MIPLAAVILMFLASLVESIKICNNSVPVTIYKNNPYQCVESVLKDFYCQDDGITIAELCDSNIKGPSCPFGFSCERTWCTRQFNVSDQTTSSMHFTNACSASKRSADQNQTVLTTVEISSDRKPKSEPETDIYYFVMKAALPIVILICLTIIIVSRVFSKYKLNRNRRNASTEDTNSNTGAFLTPTPRNADTNTPHPLLYQLQPIESTLPTAPTFDRSSSFIDRPPDYKPTSSFDFLPPPPSYNEAVQAAKNERAANQWGSLV